MGKLEKNLPSFSSNGNQLRALCWESNDLRAKSIQAASRFVDHLFLTGASIVLRYMWNHGSKVAFFAGNTSPESIRDTRAHNPSFGGARHLPWSPKLNRKMRLHVHHIEPTGWYLGCQQALKNSYLSSMTTQRHSSILLLIRCKVLLHTPVIKKTLLRLWLDKYL